LLHYFLLDYDRHWNLLDYLYVNLFPIRHHLLHLQRYDLRLVLDVWDVDFDNYGFLLAQPYWHSLFDFHVD